MNKLLNMLLLISCTTAAAMDINSGMEELSDQEMDVLLDSTELLSFDSMSANDLIAKYKKYKTKYEKKFFITELVKFINKDKQNPEKDKSMMEKITPLLFYGCKENLRHLVRAIITSVEPSQLRQLLNATASHGRTGLLIACQYNATHAVQTLIDEMNFDFIDNSFKATGEYTVNYWAATHAEKGDRGLLKLVLRYNKAYDLFTSDCTLCEATDAQIDRMMEDSASPSLDGKTRWFVNRIGRAYIYGEETRFSQETRNALVGNPPVGIEIKPDGSKNFIYVNTITNKKINYQLSKRSGCCPIF